MAHHFGARLRSITLAAEARQSQMSEQPMVNRAMPNSHAARSIFLIWSSVTGKLRTWVEATAILIALMSLAYAGTFSIFQAYTPAVGAQSALPLGVP